MIRQRKNARTCWNQKGKSKKATQVKLTIQLGKINQKVLVKEGTLKRYRDKLKLYRQNWTFRNNEKNYTSK